MEMTDMSNALPFFRPGGKQPLLQCVVYGGAGGGQVCHSNINPILSPTIYNCEIAPELGFAILVAFEEK